MKKIIGLLLSFLLSPNWVSANCNDHHGLDWLVGDWIKQTKNGAIVESWARKNDSSSSSINLSGIGYSLDYSLDHENKKVINEELRIIEMAGEVFLIAKPNQNPVPVAFKLVACNTREARFENEQHDFPQKLEYKREGDKLKINVTGEKQRGFSLELVRRTAKEESNPSRLSLVESYVEAFNARNIEKMLSMVTDDVHWMSIIKVKTAVETSSKQALGAVLKDYFVQVPSVKSQWIKANTFGNWAFGVEQVSWQSSQSTSGQKEVQTITQCSLSVYQFEGQLIKRVWYFPSESC